jgi:hypothetical protein
MKYSGTIRRDLKPAVMGNLLCCVQVDQSTVAIREQFGKFDSVLEPGCHCLPWMVGKRVAGHLTLRLQQLDVRCETKTKVYHIHLVKWIPTCVLFLTKTIISFYLGSNFKAKNCIAQFL